MSLPGALILGVLALGADPAVDEIVLENGRLRAVLGADAVWRSVRDKASGQEHLARKTPFASAVVGGKGCPASSAARTGDRLEVRLAGADTRLVYAVSVRPDWIALRLEAVEGTRPSRLTLARLAVNLSRRVGRRLAAGWDDEYALGLAALNLQTEASAHRAGEAAELAAATQDGPGPRLEGAAAALVGAPPSEYREILRRLAAEFDLPRNEGDGRPSKELPLARQSYWFLTFGEADADRVVDLCRKTGFRQVMMNSGSWCRTVGHYTFHTGRYPDGPESLRRTVARLHENGILVGMHAFASKVSKTDAYVTPVPDRRFLVDRSAALAAPVGPADREIRVSGDLRDWPGSPAAAQKEWEGGVAKHQEAILDDEIVRYRAIGPEGRWDTFLGCERGAWGTRPAAHGAGTVARHYAVDGCIDGYIIDQETTLLDEVAARLAEIFNACGFDMVYFDGGEDVDRRRFPYYVSKFQDAAMRRFRRRPLVHMGTILTHNLWHSFTRSGTVDTYLNTIHGRLLAGGTVDRWPTVREHIDRSVDYLLSVGEDMMPGELGWFGIWPRGDRTDGLQLDEIEYLMARSLAYDAPVSLQASFAQMEKHPLTPGVLEIVRVYEGLRAAGGVGEVEARRLRQKGKDHLLILGGAGPEFVEAAPLASVAGGRDLRALVGERGGGAVASLWHFLGREGILLLPVDPARVRAADLEGRPIPVRSEGGKASIPFGGRRTTLFFEGMGVGAARAALEAAVTGE